MKAMFEQSVLPLLLQEIPEIWPLQIRTYKIFGLPEPRINRMIPYADLPEGVEVAFGLDYPLVHLKLKADGKDALQRLDLAELLVLKSSFPTYGQEMKRDSSGGTLVLCLLKKADSGFG